MSPVLGFMCLLGIWLRGLKPPKIPRDELGRYEHINNQAVQR